MSITGSLMSRMTPAGSISTSGPRLTLSPRWTSSFLSISTCDVAGVVDANDPDMLAFMRHDEKLPTNARLIPPYSHSRIMNAMISSIAPPPRPAFSTTPTHTADSPAIDSFVRDVSNTIQTFNQQIAEIMSENLEKEAPPPPSASAQPFQPILDDEEEKTFLTGLSDSATQPPLSNVTSHRRNPSELVDVIASIKTMTCDVPSLPPTIHPATLLLAALNVENVPETSRSVIVRHVTSLHSIRLYEAAFHYVTVIAFTDASSFAAPVSLLFTRMSRHFLSLFTALTTAQRDSFCQFYYIVLARALYDGLVKAYEKQWRFMQTRRSSVEYNVASTDKQHKQMTADESTITPPLFAITYDQIVSRCAEWTLGFVPATSTHTDKSKLSRRSSLSPASQDQDELFVYKQRVTLAQSKMISHIVPSAYNKSNNMMLTLTSPTRLPSVKQRPTHVYNDLTIRPIYQSLSAAEELTRSTRKAFRQSKRDLVRSERLECADLVDRHHKLSQSEHIALQKDNVTVESAALITHWQTSEYKKWKAKSRTLSLRKVAAQQSNKQTTNERNSAR